MKLGQDPISTFLRGHVKARSNQSILKEISPEYSLEGPMLKLKLQYFGHLMQRIDSLEKTLMLGKIEGGRRRGQQRMRWLDGITNWMDWVWVSSRSWWWTGKPGVLQSMGWQRVRSNWVTELNQTESYIFGSCENVHSTSLLYWWRNLQHESWDYKIF